MPPKGKGKKSGKKIQAFVQHWCKELTKEAAYDAHEEEDLQLQMDTRVLNRFVKKHIQRPRTVEGVKPTGSIVRQTFEEKLAMAKRKGEIQLYFEAQERRNDLLIMWRAATRLQRQFRKNFAIKLKAVLQLQAAFRMFKQRQAYMQTEGQVRKRQAAAMEKQLAKQAAMQMLAKMRKQYEKESRTNLRTDVDLCLADICAELWAEEKAEADEQDHLEEQERKRGIFGPRFKPKPMPPRVQEDGTPVVRYHTTGKEKCPIDSLLVMSEWPSRVPMDNDDDLEHYVTRIQSAWRSRLVRKEIVRQKEEADRERRRNYVPKDPSLFTEYEVAQIIKCQAYVRRFNAMNRYMIKKMDLASKAGDSAECIEVFEKPHTPYANHLTRIVAESKEHLAELTAAGNLAYLTADVQLLDIRKPSKENLFPPVQFTPVCPRPTRPMTALVGVGKHVVDSRTTLSAGLARDVDEMGINAAIPEDEEQIIEEPIDSAMESQQTVREAAQQRLARCRELISGGLPKGVRPEQMHDQLTKELDAILWRRNRAPPVYHLGADGKLAADPFAPSASYYTPIALTSDKDSMRAPEEPDTWDAAFMEENRNRRLGIMEERRRQTTAFLQAMEKQMHIEMGGSDNDSDAGTVVSKSGRRRGKLNKKALRRLDRASSSRTSRSGASSASSVASSRQTSSAPRRRKSASKGRSKSAQV